MEVIARAGYSGFPPEPSCRAAPLRKLAKINHEERRARMKNRRNLRALRFVVKIFFLKSIAVISRKRIQDCAPIMGNVIPINEQTATDLSPRHFFKSGYNNN
jgi:hypothetical protein